MRITARNKKFKFIDAPHWVLHSGPTGATPKAVDLAKVQPIKKG